MTRRITAAIVGVAVIVVVLLGVPLAVAARSSIRDAEVVRAQATASRTLVEIVVPLDVDQLRSITAEPDAPPPFTVYDATGARLVGPGPATADSFSRDALAGSTVTTITDTAIVVAAPIVDHTNEHTVGAVTIERSLGAARHRTLIAWTIMAGAAILALGFASGLARRLARRLARPIDDLAADAARLGASEVIPLRPATGVAELDTLAGALHRSSEQLIEVLARERNVSADIAHQLRTPITAMRLHIERAGNEPDAAVLAPITDDLDRLQATVEHLLDAARHERTTSSELRVDQVVSGAVEPWRQRALTLGRSIVMQATPTLAIGSDQSLRQALDVLVDNALVHGTGDVTVAIRTPPGGVTIDVADHGTISNDVAGDLLFQRGHGDGHGLGLALARSLIERDGGRLRLSRRDPTTFSIVLLAAPEPARSEMPLPSSPPSARDAGPAATGT